MSAPATLEATPASTISELESVRARLAVVAADLEHADRQQAIEAISSAKVAKEWARVQRLGQEMQAELQWIEALALRRLGRIGDDAAPKHLRGAAQHLATMTDDEMRQFLVEHPSSSAFGAYRRFLKGSYARQARSEGRDWALNPSFSEDPDVARDAARHSEDIRGALVAIIDDLPFDAPRSIQEIATELVGEYLPDHAEDREVIRGISSVVREALVNAEPPPGYKGLPRFIPVRRPEGNWQRVPIETVSFGHLSDYLTLRVEQLRQYEQAVDDLRLTVKAARNRYERRTGREPRDDDRLFDSFAESLRREGDAR